MMLISPKRLSIDQEVQAFFPTQSEGSNRTGAYSKRDDLMAEQILEQNLNSARHLKSQNRQRLSRLESRVKNINNKKEQTVKSIFEAEKIIQNLEQNKKTKEMNKQFKIVQGHQKFLQLKEKQEKNRKYFLNRKQETLQRKETQTSLARQRARLVKSANSSQIPIQPKIDVIRQDQEERQAKLQIFYEQQKQKMGITFNSWSNFFKLNSRMTQRKAIDYEEKESQMLQKFTNSQNQFYIVNKLLENVMDQNPLQLIRKYGSPKNPFKLINPIDEAYKCSYRQQELNVKKRYKD